MELDDFVQQSLLKIVRGVKAAQDDCKQFGAAINPHSSLYGRVQNTPRVISFDIAVTVRELEGHEAGGKISVLGIGGAGGKLLSSADKESLSRLSFEVPVQLPAAQPISEFVHEAEADRIRSGR